MTVREGYRYSVRPDTGNEKIPKVENRNAGASPVARKQSPQNNHRASSTKRCCHIVRTRERRRLSGEREVIKTYVRKTSGIPLKIASRHGSSTSTKLQYVMRPHT